MASDKTQYIVALMICTTGSTGTCIPSHSHRMCVTFPLIAAGWEVIYDYAVSRVKCPHKGH